MDRQCQRGGKRNAFCLSNVAICSLRSLACGYYNSTILHVQDDVGGGSKRPKPAYPGHLKDVSPRQIYHCYATLEPADRCWVSKSVFIYHLIRCRARHVWPCGNDRNTGFTRSHHRSLGDKATSRKLLESLALERIYYSQKVYRVKSCLLGIVRQRPSKSTPKQCLIPVNSCPSLSTWPPAPSCADVGPQRP